MTMKLNLLFIVMDILTLLAYPIIFVFGKRRQLLTHLTRPTVIPSRRTSGRCDVREGSLRQL